MNRAPPAEVAHTSQRAGLHRDSFVIALCIFVTVFATHARLGRLPLRALIKTEFALAPEEMASFFAIAGLAWYLKPLAGVLSDRLRFFGTRRRHYLIASGLLGVAAWGAMAAAPRTYGTILVVSVVLSAVAVVGNTTAGGMLVDVGRARNATGRLSALRVTVMNAASLIAGPAGGWLASQRLSWTCAAGGVLMAGMTVGAWIWARDPALPVTPDDQKKAARRSPLGLFKMKSFWCVAALTLLFYGSPGFQTAFYYHQRDSLRFTDQEIGLLAALNCGGGFLGAFCYIRLCRRFSLRALLASGIVISALCACTYWVYRSLEAAVVIEPVVGFFTIIGVLPLQDLTARAAPPRDEAFAFSAILSMGNLAIALSDVLGTAMMRRFNIDLSQAILVNALASLVALLFLAPLPKSLVGTTETQALGSA